MELEILVTVLGLIQGVLALLNKRSNWIVYALQMGALVVFSFYAKLYGDMVQSAVYMFICLFSYWAWKNSKLKKTTHTTKSTFALIVATTVVLTYVVGKILSKTDDPMPYVDAFTTITTIIALLLMSAHKIECWIVWLVNDFAYLYEYYNLPNPAFYLFCLYIVWIVMAVLSYYNWYKTYKSELN